MRRRGSNMKLLPYLYFGGNAKEALEFYKDILGAEITSIQYFKDVPGMDIEEGHKDKVMHAELKFGDNLIYISDDMQSDNVEVGSKVYLHIEFDNEADILRVYEAFAKEGQVGMSLQDTFWNAKYGSVTDKFKTQWSLNYFFKK
jgi:PhnB protein